MDGLTSLLTAAVQPWDAVICTSTSSRAVIETLFGRQEDHLSRRLGASRFVRPQLPVIPLGVDCEAQGRRSERTDKARSSLGIEPGDFVVLFLGRLSFHAKANPAPMYLALERLACRHQVVLIECGWTANDHITQAFSEARAKLCPSVRSIVLDGRSNEVRDTAWAAADVFCSLSDNIQETFGLTPIEAMAAGLPVVVTDWDGYKDPVGAAPMDLPFRPWLPRREQDSILQRATRSRLTVTTPISAKHGSGLRAPRGRSGPTPAHGR